MLASKKHRKQRRECTSYSELPDDSDDFRDFKLLSDPFIRPGAQKIYRLDGILPCNSGASVVVSDPRPSPSYATRTITDLPLPKFKVDNYWVGPVPAREVSFFNLNDNVNDEFLQNICSKYGETEEVQVYYHPMTKKHLGLGKAIFKISRGAKDCVFTLNNTTIMGSVVRVVFDSLGCQRTKVYDNLIKNTVMNSATTTLPVSDHLVSTQAVMPANVSTPQANVLKVPPPFPPLPSSMNLVNSKGPVPPPIPPAMFSVPPPVVFGSQFHRTVPFTPSVPPPPTPRMLPMPIPPVAAPVPIPPFSIPPSPNINSLDFQNPPVLSVTRPPPFLAPSHVRFCPDVRFNRPSAFPLVTSCSFPPPPIPQHFPNHSPISLQNTSPAQLNTSENEEDKSSVKTSSWKKRIAADSNQSYIDGSRKESLDSRIAALLGNSEDSVTSNKQPLPDLINSVSDSICKSIGISPWVPFTPSIPPPPLPPRLLSVPPARGLGKPSIPNHALRDFHSCQLWNWESMKYNDRLRKKMLKDKFHVLTKKVFSMVLSELKGIMRRDLSKRMVENLAFKHLDDWWNMQEKKSKILKLESKFGSNNNSNVVEKPSKTYIHSLDASYAAISALLAKNSRSGLDSGDISGFSFRAQLPKFPSFKKRSSVSKQSCADNSTPLLPQKTTAGKDATNEQTISQPIKVEAVDEIYDIRTENSPSIEAMDVSDSSLPADDKPSKDLETDHRSTKRKAEECEECDTDFIATINEAFHLKSVLMNERESPLPLTDGDCMEVDCDFCGINAAQATIDPQEMFTVPTRSKSATSLFIVSNEKSNIVNTPDDDTNDSVDLKHKSNGDLIRLDCLPNYSVYDEHNYANVEATSFNKKNSQKHTTSTRSSNMLAKKSVPHFERRLNNIEMKNLYCFLTEGIDDEDMHYLKLSYERLLDVSVQSDWLNDTHWVPHPCTKLMTNEKCPHPISGCARAEGYYKLAPELKTVHYGPAQINLAASDNSTEVCRSIQMSREARSLQRRLIANLGDADFAEIFRFSQLKLRKKNIQFARSRIHEWGLYACEHIGAEEMVIEYVGETVRQTVADVRERRHFAEGIGGSYMFRIDSDVIIDATKCGNLARFINHSCDPNCYAKIITMDSCKKVVIYSKRDITPGEEITYDYKFPIEDKKIPCTCGASNCRKSLN